MVEGQVRAALVQGLILVNPITYAELAPAFATQLISTDGSIRLSSACTVAFAAGWSAAQAFVKYRRAEARRAHHCLTSTLARMLKLKADSRTRDARAIALTFRRRTHHSVAETNRIKGVEWCQEMRE